MEKPQTTKEVQDIVKKEFDGKKIPKNINDLTITVTEKDGMFTVLFKFKVITSHDDWWFKWLKGERPEKILSYCEDAHSYIMKKSKAA